MSFPLLQGIELLTQVQLALRSDNDTRKNTASDVLQEFIHLSTEALHRSNELAIKFRDLSQHMINEAKLLRDAAHVEALNRMKEYEQKIKDDANKCKEVSEHDETIKNLCEAANKMREEAHKLRDTSSQKITDDI
jgi:5'-deoxynucleotidase YfbR-like HD superfamily hydrolase